MVVVIVLVVVVLVGYAIRYFNGLNAGGRGGYARNSKLRAQAAAEHQRNLAARTELASGAGLAPVDAEESAESCLGVEFETGAPTGLIVRSVAPRSAAARVGLPAGATLVSVNGTPVATTAAADAAVATRRPGLPLYLVWRIGDDEHHADLVV